MMNYKAYTPIDNRIKELIEEILHPKKPDCETKKYWIDIDNKANVLFLSKDICKEDKVYLRQSGMMEILYMTVTSFVDY